MAAAEQLITANLDIWSSAVQMKSAAGRGKSNKLELYGVKKLRELILELAVRGLLVPQDPNDEPASELLKEIAAEKAKLVKDGKIKKQKVLPAIEEDEKPFELPNEWQWARLNDLAPMSLFDGDWVESKDQDPDGDIRLIQLADIGVNEFKNVSEKYINEDAFDRLNCTELNAGDVLIARLPSPIGRACIFPRLDEKAVTAVDVAIFRPCGFVLDQYLVHSINSTTFRSQVEAYGKGATRFRISTGNLKTVLVPVCPGQEQNRIVAKVDELMALCDQLEQQQETSITAHQTLVKTLLDALTTASECDGFTAAWARIADHFDTLFTTEWSINQLKQTILQLAIMGKLVPQDPNDEPASELLKKIAAEKAQLVKDGKIKKQKVLPEIGADEKPFELPKGWRFERLGNLLLKITDGTHHSPPNTESGDFLYISAKNIKNEGVQLSNATYVTKKVHEEIYARCNPELNDILYIKDGATTGIATINQLSEEFSMLSSVALLKCSNGVFNRFLLLSLRSPYFYEAMRAGMTGVAITRVTLKKLNYAFIALPPLPEQERIVDKVDELLKLADRLKEKLYLNEQIALAFAEAAVMTFAGDNLRETVGMKESPPIKKADQDKGRARKPSDIQKFVLRRFRISTGYRSLPDTECGFHADNELPEESEPVCLVGLNGSGKSNLIEAVADVFCYLEMINLPWEALKSDTSKYRKNDHHFELEYTVTTADGAKHVLIKKAKKIGAEFLLIDEDGQESKVEDSEERLALLPRRIIGYSSGLNETVSHPFLRTRTLYSGEVREAAPPVGSELSLSKAVFDTNTLYMDYENNAEILLCNYIFRNTDELAFINEFTRVEGVSSFSIKFNRKIAGKTSPNNIARITEELDSYVEKFASCAGKSYQSGEHEYEFRFELNEKVKKKFRKEFETAEKLFLGMYKWSLLNALVLSDQQRKVFLREDVTSGTLERPPVVPPKDRLFDVADVKVLLSTPKKVIDYSGLSDGEHQFIQVFGTVLLFNEPGSLFLLDEPESHFNPEWRTKFNSVLNGIPNASTHEFVISTHSPYIVSGSKGSNVYKFTRNGPEVDCQPIDFETYGASFDVLLKKLFSIDSLIDESAREEMQSILQRGDLEEMEEAVEDFAESREKRRLYEAIIKKQSEQA